MIIDNCCWGSQILFASACAVIGIVGVVQARNDAERRMRRSVLLQAILLAYVVSASFSQHQRELSSGGIVIVGLLIIQSTLGSPVINDKQSSGEEQSAS